MKEGVEIDQEVGSKFERTGDMVDGLPRIVTHDERVGGIRFTTVDTMPIVV